MQAGHRRVLVGDLLHGAGVEGPHGLEALEGVDEAVVQAVEVEEARGHQRVQREADERQRRRERQRVAPAGVALGEAPEDVDQGEGGDDEVEGAVEDVPELDEEAADGEGRVLDRLLVEDADGPLDADDVEGVVEGVLSGHAGRTLRVPDGAVHQVEGEDVQHLLPPPQAALATADRRGKELVGLGGVRPRRRKAHAAACTERRPLPTAKAGAPSRLTVRVMP